MLDTIIVHSGELCLKGGNRGMFEKKLIDDAASRLSTMGDFRVERRQGSILFLHQGPMSPAQAEACAAALPYVFGAAHFLLATRCDKDLDRITETATALLATEERGTFKVSTRRSDKSFPFDSQEVSRRVGGSLLERLAGFTVDVHDPRHVVHVEIGKKDALVALRRIDGAGGLPRGVSGRIAALLSGGIDSPVAAWKTMRRGCEAVFVHFHSYPFTDRASLDKAKRLAGTLARWQGKSTVHFVPLAEAQREITAKTDPALRVVLYRRMMLRIAERIAAENGALGLVTGDSIGQVASQTLENLRAVTAVATIPVYRPLVGEDKNDIIALAKKIGTYGISVEPHDDCCSLFMPPRPATRSTPAAAEREERKYDVEGLMRAAMAAAERTAVEPEAAFAARPEPLRAAA